MICKHAMYQGSRICILRFLRFQKSRQQKLSPQSFEMSSHTSLSDLCKSFKLFICQSLMYLRAYRHLSHTALTCIVSCECEHYTSAFLSKMFDLGDLTALTFGNWVFKTGVIKWPLKLYARCYVLNKKHDFYVF